MNNFRLALFVLGGVVLGAITLKHLRPAPPPPPPIFSLSVGGGENGGVDLQVEKDGKVSLKAGDKQHHVVINAN